MGVKPKVSSVSIRDSNNHAALNSVFGDIITSKRVASIASQFVYGVDGASITNTATGGGVAAIEDQNMLVLRSGAAAGGSIRVESVDPLQYIPGYEAQAYFTAVMSRPTGAGYVRAGVYDDNDGFRIEMRAAGFFFIRRHGGVDADVIAQSAFNQDRLDGQGPSGMTLNPSDMNGNIFLIRYGFLGFAPISLMILGADGAIYPVHTIKYPNTSKVTHIQNTYLPARAEVSNGATAENVFIKIGSINLAVVDGEEAKATNRTFGKGLTGTLLGAGGYNRRPLIVFRNNPNFQGPLMPAPKVHRIGAILDYLYLALDGHNKDVLVQLFLIPSSAQVGAGVSFTAADANSVLSYSVSSTLNYGAYPDGINPFSFGITTALKSFDKDVDKFNFNLRPGYDAVFALTSTTTLDISWIFTNLWHELF